MKLFNNKWILFIFNIFLVFLLSLFMTRSYSFVTYINILFFVSGFYILLFLFLYTLKGGFYDGVTYGFRRFSSIMSKGDYLEEWKEKRMPSEAVPSLFYHHVKYQAILLLWLLVFLLAIYYIV